MGHFLCSCRKGGGSKRFLGLGNFGLGYILGCTLERLSREIHGRRQSVV